MGRNYNTKNLKATELGSIQTMLNEGKTPSEIARELEREKSCLYKEIKNYSYYVDGINCLKCLNRKDCNQHFLCSNIPNRTKCSMCKDCKHAAGKCYSFKTDIKCDLLKKHHHVCNGCEQRRTCKKPQKIYNANRALIMHETVQGVARKDLMADSLPKEFKIYISDRIKLGHSPEVILNTLPDKYKEYDMAVSTLYYAIDKGCFDCDNLHLRNKVGRVGYGSSNHKRNNSIKTHHLNGRSIEDLPEFIKKEKPLGYHELDTVEGIKGGELLFTICIPIFSILLAFKISNKTQAEIKKVLDGLEEKLKAKFYVLFKYGVPDNGGEFLDFDAIETSINSKEDIPVKRVSLFYTHPGASYEKPHIENIHTLLRWLIAKKVDITLLSADDILNIVNRLNNYPRKKLSFLTPLRALEKELGSEIISLLGLEHISIDLLNMKDMILEDVITDVENDEEKERTDRINNRIKSMRNAERRQYFANKK